MINFHQNFINMISNKIKIGDTIIVGYDEDIMNLQKMKVEDIYDISENEYYFEGVITDIIN